MPIDPLSVATMGYLQNPSALSTSYALTMASLGWLKTIGDIPIPPEPEPEEIRRHRGKGGGLTVVNVPRRREKIEVDKREHYDLIIRAGLAKINGEKYLDDFVKKLVFKHTHDPANDPTIKIKSLRSFKNKINVTFKEVIARHSETTANITSVKIKQIPVRTVVSGSNPENIAKKTLIKASLKNQKKDPD